MKKIWLAVLLFCTVSLAALWIQDFARIRKLGEAREQQQRLVRASLQLLQGARPGLKDFWQQIGRKEPLRDPWGNPHRLEDHLWRSAGPDGLYLSADDLVAQIPGEEGVGVDFTRSDWAEEEPAVSEAK